jgi:Carboxylesterase family
MALTPRVGDRDHVRAECAQSNGYPKEKNVLAVGQHRMYGERQSELLTLASPHVNNLACVQFSVLPLSLYSYPNALHHCWGYRLTVNKKWTRSLVLLMVCAVVSISAFAVQSKGTDAVVVKTVAGLVKGETERGVLVFRGIRYAASPAGPLRFHPPVPPVAWTEVWPALDFAPACPQLVEIDPTENNNSVMSEDCLAVNVWTPGADNKKRPVDHQLVRFGVLQLLGNGIRNIQCFQDKRGETQLSEYLKATVTGSPITIAKKTGTSIAEIMRSLFDLYSEGRISLTKNPAKALFYSLRQDLSDALNAEISKQLKEKLDYRLANFEDFLQLVESGAGPEQMICRYLGINCED